MDRHTRSGVGEPRRCEGVEGSSDEADSRACCRFGAERLSQAPVDSVLEREPFSYWHEDQWKSGFYDPSSKVFVGKTIDGRVNTVMTKVEKSYISRLQGRRP